MEKRARTRGVIAAILAVVLAISATSVWLNWPQSSGAAGGGGPQGVTTGLDALSMAEQLIHERSTATWAPISVVGVSSALPFQPWVRDWSNFSLDLATERACQSIPIPTVWNGSSSLTRSGNITDGTAAFWQFILMNESGPGVYAFIVAVYLNGWEYLAGPLGSSNPCIAELGLGTPSFVTGVALPTIDSNTAAGAVLGAATSYLHGYGSYALVWTDGLPVISNLGVAATLGPDYSSNWSFDFYRCGLASITPTTGSTTSMIGVVGGTGRTVSAGVTITSTDNCTLQNYTVSLGTPTYHSSAGGSSYSVPVSVRKDFQGLAAWMLAPRIVNANGSYATPGPLGCVGWQSSLLNCTPRSGWNIILVSPNGSWLSSYGMASAGGQWSNPAAPVLSNDSLVVVSSSPTFGGGATLTILENASLPTVPPSSVVL